MAFPTNTLLLVLCILVSCGLHPCDAQEWTRFRGPNGSGVGTATNVPNSWSKDSARWKFALPGEGHASPVLWSSNLYLVSADTRNLFLTCADADLGKERWSRSYPYEAFAKHNYNSYASGTPATDDRHVYVAFAFPGAYRVLALDHTGKPIWQRDLGPFKSQHGGGHSLVLHQGLLIVANEQDGASAVLALDVANGQTRWSAPRRTVEAAYATPCIYQPSRGAAQLVLSSEAHGISALDPLSGKLLWEYGKAFDKRVVSSPIVVGDLIVGSCGSGGGGNYAVAIRPPGKGGPLPELAYAIRKSAPYVPTSVYSDGWLFLWSDGGILTCANASTGEVQYQERVGGNYFGSPVLMDKRLICVSTRGEVVVAQASKEFKVLGRTPLNEVSHSTPALARGKLYVRTLGHVYCVGGD